MSALSNGPSLLLSIDQRLIAVSGENDVEIVEYSAVALVGSWRVSYLPHTSHLTLGIWKMNISKWPVSGCASNC